MGARGGREGEWMLLKSIKLALGDGQGGSKERKSRTQE